MKNELVSFNYILGTQAFAPNYTFTDQDPIEEVAGQIAQMGSNILKCAISDIEQLNRLVKLGDFRHILMWYRSSSAFRDGYSPELAKQDYDAIYTFTKQLLTTYNTRPITFYIGHWEGDWYYLQGYDTEQKNVPAIVTQGMVDWLNNRQKAVDDAKRDTAHEGVQVWNYIEVNRPYDAYKKGYDRVVNKVLPHTNVDYVSYSAYDVMDLAPSEISAMIDYIYDRLPAKDGIPGARVFIGEMGQPAANCDRDGECHARVNLTNIGKFLACRVKFVLYWQMYSNETLPDGSDRGFWLIDDKNEKQPLYHAFKEELEKAKIWVRQYQEIHGVLPSEEEYRCYLREQPVFHNATEGEQG